MGRLLLIQLFRSSYLAGIAKKQHNFFVQLEPLRGTVYDTHLKPQAVNIPVDSVYAAANEIKDQDKESIARILSQILALKPSFLRERLGRKKSFVWLARKITPEQARQIRNLDIKGIGFLKESKRSYPNNYLASHMIGFAGLDNIGLEGLEAAFDGSLRGEPGWAVFLRDARQKKLDLWENMVPPKDGYDIVLTVDSVIQYIAERELAAVCEAYDARGASIVVMDPHTGRILALANRPTYDLNGYKGARKEVMKNRAVVNLFEPGSVFKIVTAAAALEEGIVSEKDIFFCENGAYRVASHILHDHHPRGNLSFKEVIQYSSNIGTVKVAQLLGSDSLYRYIKAFGFGSRLGVDLPGEISGMIRAPRHWSKISISAIPIGQEVGVTVLQMASAFSVIANGGQLMKPFVVQEIRDKRGETIKSFAPRMIRKVISVDTANRVKAILTSVVEEGTGRSARMKEFKAAGKTGTAQKIEANGAYSHEKFFASFIGFAPVDDPLVTIAVVVDEPRPYYYGGVVAAPVFRKVAEDVIRYLKRSASSYESVTVTQTN